MTLAARSPAALRSKKGYAELFAGSPPTKIQIAMDSLRLLSADTQVDRTD